MKFRTFKALTIALAICFITPIAVSEESQISIEADAAKFNFNTGERLYEGNVLLQQLNLTVKADRVVITPQEGKSKEYRLEASGSPVELRDLPKNDIGWVNGRANQLIMLSDSGQVELHGDVHFDSSEATVQTQSMYYNSQDGSFETKNVDGSSRTQIQFKGNF